MNLIKAKKKGDAPSKLREPEFVLREEGAIARKIDKAEILVGIRPEKILIEAGRPQRGSEARQEDGNLITLSGKISTVEPLGRETLYHVGLEGCQVLVLSDKIDARRGDAMQLSFYIKDIHLFDPAAS
jgi:ABC-type sugar transport system ATPase subunit